MAGYSKEAERQNKALGNLLKGQEVEKRSMVGYEGKQKEKGDIKSELTDIMSEVRVPLFCPKCKKGTIIRGKNAYGCSHYKEGCSYVFTFEKVKEIANGKPLSKELVLEIISS